jgi:GntP family gluconate:H+ symporter
LHPFLLLLIGIVVVVGGMLALRLHAFLALLLGALVVGALTPREAIERHGVERGLSEAAAKRQAQAGVGERLADGFGRTAGQIGIMVAMASIIGAGLLESGSADRIVRSALRFLGERRAGAAFMSSGYLLGIPVFFDTVFYLTVPLAKAMRVRTGKDYLLYVLAITAGATMTHSLVPPTPGPLFVASELKVDIATMIAAGCLFGAVTAAAGFAFALWANRRFALPLRESEASLRQLEEVAARDVSRLPPLWLALAPILLPVLLITLASLAPPAAGVFGRALATLGDKNVALSLGAAIALLTLLGGASAAKTGAAVQDALASAGVIILITAAGGAFGGTLQQTGIGAEIRALTKAYDMPVLPLAFLLTMLVRTAQGSATVAMITASGVLAGMATPELLGFHPVYLAQAIGCGSKPIWWMNDSGFWVVSKMSGLSEAEGLKVLTTSSAIMGVVGLIAIMIAAKLFPLV